MRGMIEDDKALADYPLTPSFYHFFQTNDNFEDFLIENIFTRNYCTIATSVGILEFKFEKDNYFSLILI
jgi:hypothetical protein